jgi:hypothetical protein
MRCAGPPPEKSRQKRVANLRLMEDGALEGDVTIELPAGYALDVPEAPAPFKASDIVSDDVKLQMTKDGRKLFFKRGFKFNGMLFPVTSYAQLKQVFDILHERDNHTITLKQSAANQ